MVFDQKSIPKSLRDSKKTTPRVRDYLFEIICNEAIDFGIASATASQIDQFNILQATFIAMRAAINKVQSPYQCVFIDGNQSPRILDSVEVVRGDTFIPEIQAASILAKVCRDNYMKKLHEKYPRYGFKTHFGYPTHQHLEMLRKWGPIEEHRQSFKPVALVCHSKPK